MLKWLGLWAMTTDHVGAILLDRPELATLIGRMAFPIFACLVGVNILRSRSPDRYIWYLLVAGLVAHPISMWVFQRPHGVPLNIMFTLASGAAISAVLLRVMPDRWYWSWWCVVPVALLVGSLSEYGGPGVALVVVCAVSAWVVKRPGIQGWVMLGPSVLCASLAAWHVNGGASGYGWVALGSLALVALVILRGDRRVGDRWFFYAYYPAHLFVLGVVVAVARTL